MCLYLIFESVHGSGVLDLSGLPFLQHCLSYGYIIFSPSVRPLCGGSDGLTGLNRRLTQFQGTHVAMSNLSLASLSRPQTYTSTSENVFLKIWPGDETGHQSSHPEVMSASENDTYSLGDASSPSLEPNKAPVGVHVLF